MLKFAVIKTIKRQHKCMSLRKAVDLRHLGLILVNVLYHFHSSVFLMTTLEKKNQLNDKLSPTKGLNGKVLMSQVWHNHNWLWWCLEWGVFHIAFTFGNYKVAPWHTRAQWKCTIPWSFLWEMTRYSEQWAVLKLIHSCIFLQFW